VPIFGMLYARVMVSLLVVASYIPWKTRSAIFAHFAHDPKSDA
jgi:hypothetical protein